MGKSATTLSYQGHFVLNEPCGYMNCPSGWSRSREVSLRLHDAELWIVRRGKGRMQTRDAEHALRPGFCALMRPGNIYDAHQDETDPLAITFLHFDAVNPRGRRQTISWSSSFPEFFELDDLDYFASVTRRIVQLFRHSPIASAALLKGVLLDIATPQGRNLSSEQTSVNRPIAQLASEIRADLTGLPSVREMAQKVSLSLEHFSRVFRKIHGHSPREFLLQTRLSRARYLLDETDIRIGEISEKLGYADIYFFSRQFKEKTGLSPTEYRHRRLATLK